MPNKNVSQLGIHKFKTIPPIVKNVIVQESNIDRARKEREEKKRWKKPEPPTPFLNHLNVIVTTQYFDEFLESSNTTKNNSGNFVDTQLGLLTTSTSNRAVDTDRSDHSSSSLSSDQMFTNDEEKSTIEFVVCNLLRSLVSDKSFHELVKRVNDDEIPYFFQYSRENVYFYLFYKNVKKFNRSLSRILLFVKNTINGESKEKSPSEKKSKKKENSVKSVKT